MSKQLDLFPNGSGPPEADTATTATSKGDDSAASTSENTASENTASVNTASENTASVSTASGNTASENTASTTTDSTARQRAACTFDRPVTVEAGAGTGKTTLLIHRLLVWTLDAGWKHAARRKRNQGAPSQEIASERTAGQILDRIVAITFTEAAATELADRFITAITNAAHLEFPPGFDRDWIETDDATVQQRTRWLMPQLDRAHISTIHAWCFEVLRRHPYVAEVQSDLEILADAQQIEAVARQVVEKHYALAYQQGYDADLVRLGEEKIGPRDLIEIARTWITADWNLDHQLPEDDGLSTALEVICSSAHALADAATPSLGTLGGKNLAPLVVEAAQATSQLDGSDPAEALQQLNSLWSDKLRKRAVSWAERDFNATEARAIRSTSTGQENIGQAATGLALYLPILRFLDPIRWGRRRRVLVAILNDLQVALNEASAITFGGLLRRTAELLNNHPEVARSERNRIDLLLVDEFQDTDSQQASLVTSLSLHQESGPCLIVVGDPKQSIYGWRSADLETYEQVQTAVRKRKGLELVLTQNFRSTGEILAATDHIVGSQMVLNPGIQPLYHPLELGASHATEPGQAVELWRTPPALKAAEATHLEAEWLAHDLQQRHSAGGLQWHQVGILMRGKTHVRTLLRALRRRGVPYVLSSDAGFHQRSEVIDGAAWVRLVADPTDEVALLKVCRSPVVGIPDGALLPLWTGDFVQLMAGFDKPNSETEILLRNQLTEAAASLGEIPGLERIEGWVELASSSLGHIGALRQTLRQHSFVEFINRLREVTAIETIEARRPEGEARTANLEKLFDQLVQQVEESGGDTHAVLRVLRRGIFFELPAEEALSLTPADGAVQVATVHAAKGLEFDHVYLIQTGSGGGHDDTTLQVEPTRPGATLIRSVAHPQWAHGRLRRRQVTEAEALRLLYVALTRARRRLVISLPGKPRANTLAKLIDSTIASSPNVWLERELTDSPDEHIDPNLDANRHQPLPNPPWTSLASPLALHQTPTSLPDHWATDQGVPDHRTPDQRASSNSAASASDPLGEAHHRRRGEVIHRLLAEIDLSDTEPQPPSSVASQKDAVDFWQRFRTSSSGQRLLKLGSVSPEGGRLRGREVDVLGDAALLGNTSNAVYATGRLDLLYQDSAGTWVIADFKTGAPSDLSAAVEQYRPQLSFYGRALQQALALDQMPRLELWFVDLDRIEEIAS